MRYLRILLTILCFVSTRDAFAQKQLFEKFLPELRQEAIHLGVSENTARAALPDGMKPITRIITLDRKQPESTKTLQGYLHDTLTKRRIEDGRTRYRDNKSALYGIGAHYEVDPQYIVALWGMETNFGRNTGGFDLIPALATLAWEGRRGDYFRGELMQALKIIDSGDVKLKDMKGSWAGAMGQTQFMPSSFHKFAQDYDGDGHRDIWKSKQDVFASAANYLAQNGWKHGEPWGRRVTLPDNFKSDLLGLDSKHTLQFWHNAGVRLKNGGSVPFEGADKASIIQPDGSGTPAYIVYDNYRVILKWNRSTYFATAIGLLADRVKG